MNDVLGNTLAMSDEFHRAVYFLTTLKLGQWHHSEVCSTKMKDFCHIPSGRSFGCERERGRNGHRSYSMTGGRSTRPGKVKLSL